MKSEAEQKYWEQIAAGKRSSFGSPPGILPTTGQLEVAYQERTLARKKLREIKRADER